VPLHAIDNPASIAYILADSEASVLVASTIGQWNAIASLAQPLPGLREVVLRDATTIGPTQAGGVSVIALEVWLARASKQRP